MLDGPPTDARPQSLSLNLETFCYSRRGYFGFSRRDGL